MNVVVRVSLAVGLLGAVGMGGYLTGARAARAHRAPPPVVVSSTSAQPAAALPTQLHVDTLSSVHTGTVDMIPGRAASPDHPGGTMYVAYVARDGNGGHPRLGEWDVSNARPVFSMEITTSDSKVDTGNPYSIRIAKGGHRVFVAVEMEGGRNVLIDAIDPAVDPHRFRYRHGYDLPGGVETSIVANEAWFVTSFRPAPNRALEVHVVSTSTMRFRELAHLQLQGDTVSKEQRASALALVEGRLYVVERPTSSETRVSELELPSLKRLNSSSRFAPASKLERSQLTSANKSLLLLDRGRLVELGLDLLVRSEKRIETDEVAIGPHGEVLTTGGLEASTVRGELVPSIGGEASCTPAWSGPFPLLACARDGTGARIARLPPVPVHLPVLVR